MSNVIPWEYVKLRIAVRERQQSIDKAFAQVRASGKVDPDLVDRCKRSDRMLTQAMSDMQAFQKSR